MPRGTNWSTEQEMILAEVILRNLRQGYSIGRAYSVAAHNPKLRGRGRSAIKAYWTKNLSGAYFNALEAAKDEGDEAKRMGKIGRKIDDTHKQWIKDKYPELDHADFLYVEGVPTEEIDIDDNEIEEEEEEIFNNNMFQTVNPHVFLGDLSDYIRDLQAENKNYRLEIERLEEQNNKYAKLNAIIREFQLEV